MDHLNVASNYFTQNKGVVTICGSTRFFVEAMEANRLLTFKGWMVFSCGSWGHSYHKYAANESHDLSLVKRLHFKKIAMSDAIVVVSDEAGYIGDSTRAEINFAKHLDLPILWFNGKEIVLHWGDRAKIPFPSYNSLESEINEFVRINGNDALGF